MLVRVDVDGLTALAALARSRVPVFLRGGFDDARAAIATSLGGDPTTADGWRALGLDPARPIVIALGRHDGAALLAAAHDRAPLLPGGAPPARAAIRPRALVVGARVVLPIADPERAAAALARLAPTFAAAAPALTVVPGAVDKGPAGRTLAIDLLAAAPHADPADVAASRAALTAARPSTAAAARARLADPTAAPLAAAPLAIHVDPLRLAEALLWWRLAADAPAPDARAIARLRALTGPIAPILAGPLRHVGAALTIAGADAHLAVTWDVAPGSPLARALAVTADSGLPRPADTPDAALHLHSYVGALAELAALPHDAMTFDLPPSPFFPYGGLAPLVDALAAPHVLGAAMAHVGNAEPSARPLFAAVRDVALVVTTIGPDLDHTAAVVEVAVAGDAEVPLDTLADALWGPAVTTYAHDAAPPVLAWGAGRLRAFGHRRLGAAAFGLALRDAAPAYLAYQRRPAAPPAGTVLELHAAPAALALVHPLGALAGTLDATARWDAASHTLAIDATLAAP